MPTQREIVGEPVEEPPEDGTRVFRYRVRHGDVVDDVQVAIPKALVPEPQNFLPAWVIGPKGRAAVERALAKGGIPKRITLGYGRHEFGENMPGRCKAELQP